MEIKREQVEALIQQGQKRGLTGKNVIDALIRKGYQPEGVNVGAIQASITKPIEKTEEPSYLKQVKENLIGTFKTGAEKVTEDISRTGDIAEEAGGSVPAKILAPLATAGNVAGDVASTAGGIIGSFLTPLIPESAKEKIGEITSSIEEKVNSIPGMTPEIAQGLGDVFNTVSLLGGNVAQKPITTATKTIASKVKGVAKQAGASIDEAVASSTEKAVSSAGNLIPKSPEIMNRVARLKPSDASKFEKLAGKTHGQYLSETGNFGTPDKIIAKEAQKFTQSLNNVDDALARLPGLYKDGSIADALSELTKKAVSESGENIKAPYLARVQSLAEKFAKDGLDMSEINEVKRLFEKNVKLGYNKLTNAEKVAQSTNIDSALRKWQVSKAKELGFENIAELNKQTQLSKFIIDKLGDQIVGQSGLNGVTLTDWIMLSGGNPTAVSGFLTKKFFSSKAVQSKIAELLNKEGIKGEIKANLKSTPESIKRAVSPQGLEQLPAPKAGSPRILINKPIYQPSRKAIEQGTEIVTRSKQLTQPQSKKLLEKPSNNTTTKVTKSSNTDPLTVEAKKYKSAEEFVNTRLSEKPVKTVEGNYGETKTFKVLEQSWNKKEPSVVMPKGSTVFRGGEDGVYYSADLGTAEGYAGSNPLKAVDISGKKLANFQEFTGGKYASDPDVDLVSIVKEALDDGYDGLYTRDNYGEVILPTKSQLTDIYNKAVGKKAKK